MSLFLIAFIFKIYSYFKDRVNLCYAFEGNIRPTNMNLINIIKSKKMWQVIDETRNINSKYSGGAYYSLNRIPCRGKTKLPFPIKANISCPVFLAKDQYIFLPDMILIKRGSKFISVSYESAQPSIHRTTIQEPKSHPGDARVIDYTYQYVNKSGGPDRRFKINPKIPICSYGELTFKSTENLNIRIQFSNDSFVESISTDKSV